MSKKEHFKQTVAALLAWYDRGHRDLPWRRTRDPYRIWVSEIMLQQTRVETALSYYERFLNALPDIAALAAVEEEKLLKLWEGLGYYSRARNLQRAAKQVMEQYAGRMPCRYEELRKLSGIGPYTAGAIASIAFGEAVPAVDGNVQRVISRLLGIRQDVGIPSVAREIRDGAAALVPCDRPGDFNNAMMELGATVCLPVRPRCEECPLREFCDAFHEGDADALPLKQKAKTQRIERQGIALILHQDRVLVERREQRLLGGLWVFPMQEHAHSAAALREALRERGWPVSGGKLLGEARHVFTHIIWEMKVYAFTAKAFEPSQAGKWVSLEELRALPIPTAVKVAKQWAEQLLSQTSEVE